MYSSALPSTSALDGGGWSTPRPGRFTPGKDPVPIVQQAGWAPGTGAENLAPAGIRSPDRPARSESLYRLRYPGHLYEECISSNMCPMWNISLPLCVVCGMYLSHYVLYAECISPIMFPMWNISLPLCAYVKFISTIMCRMWNVSLPFLCLMWNVSLPLCAVSGMHLSHFVSYVECISHYVPYVECISPIMCRMWNVSLPLCVV